MNPQLVNAVNLPAMNALNFPAAILQPPYFDPTRPAVMDYGAIGRHHRPRDQPQLRRPGRPVRRERPARATGGRRRTSRTSRRRRRQLVRQYDAYRPFPDLAVNGKLTVSENIADVAGLAAAYDAYRLSLGGKEAPTVQGLTGRPAVLPRASRRAGGRRSREAALRQQRPDRRPRARTSTAPTRCATSTPGTPRSASSRARSSTSPRRPASGSGDLRQAPWLPGSRPPNSLELHRSRIRKPAKEPGFR